jgi:hypothetical protein
MSFFAKAALLLLFCAQSVYSTALDDYVWKPDDNYNWVDLVCADDLQNHFIKFNLLFLITNLATKILLGPGLYVHRHG